MLLRVPQKFPEPRIDCSLSPSMLYNPYQTNDYFSTHNEILWPLPSIRPWLHPQTSFLNLAQNPYPKLYLVKFHLVLKAYPRHSLFLRLPKTSGIKQGQQQWPSMYWKYLRQPSPRTQRGLLMLGAGIFVRQFLVLGSTIFSAPPSLYYIVWSTLTTWSELS